MPDLSSSRTSLVNARIDTVLALLNQCPEFGHVGAETLFPRPQLAALLELTGDPWTTALLAELGYAKRRAEEIVANTSYERVVQGLVGVGRPLEASARSIRRAVSRPMEAAMLRARELLARLSAENLPMNAAAAQMLDENLLGLQRAWALYTDHLLLAYVQLRDNESPLRVSPSLPPANSAIPQRRWADKVQASTDSREPPPHSVFH
jgi:hypothetical protein